MIHRAKGRPRRARPAPPRVRHRGRRTRTFGRGQPGRSNPASCRPTSLAHELRRGHARYQLCLHTRGEMTLSIEYESEQFPSAFTFRFGTLKSSWDELLWAAITIGRPS